MAKENNTYNKEKTVALIGSPNVGKSSVFNFLTGQNQHTGNWTGKTVENTRATLKTTIGKCSIVDTPGTYSLDAQSEEERITRDFLLSGKVDFAVIVCDAEMLSRNLFLCLQIIQTGINCALCLNLMDEARKHKTIIDVKKLEQMLGIEVVPFSARKRQGKETLIEIIERGIKCEKNSFLKEPHINAEENSKKAKEIAEAVFINKKERKETLLDKALTSKLFGYPIMFLLLMLVFWLTISAANYPSELLGCLFSYFEEKLSAFLVFISVPTVVHDAIVFGIFRVLSTVVSVMLPPMAIFFPLFAVLEESGILPRIAFNLDRPFALCKSCGKQALTMCMGFGCNAAGVMGCRIINTKRERIIAAVTNCFVPCNGKFPAMIIVISVFFGVGIVSAFGLTLVILLGVLATFAASFVLSKTWLRGTNSSFVLELPPYRIPDFGRVMLVSLKEKTFKLALRAVKVAAPAGLIIWLLANIKVGNSSLLSAFSSLLEPIGRFIGLDGVILCAFILGFPANEIVLPIAIMGYCGGSSISNITSISQIGEILIQNGWTNTTAVCFLIFSLLHFPCSTTFLTVKKETGSLKWALISAVLPSIFGFCLCAVINIVSTYI